MNSLKTLKMKKSKDLLASHEEVSKVRDSLEKKTAKTFRQFARSKQKAQELAHLKYLD